MNIVQISCLGSFGRFGNQLFQYLFAKAYAERYGAVLETPDWIGRKIFKLENTRNITRHLPRTGLDDVPWGRTNIDLFGYFQFKECYDLLSNNFIKRNLIFQDRWLQKYSEKGDYIAAHLRRGDYCEKYSNIFCIVSENSYLNACDKYGLEKSKIKWFSEESVSRDHKMEEQGLGFLDDFFKIMNAKYILRANSTFSFWAAYFSNATVYSPLITELAGWQDVEFMPGNMQKLIHPSLNHATPKPPCDIIFKG
jgi:hypothetical protein